MYRKCIFERIFVTPKRQYFEKSENEMSIHNFCVQEVSKAHLKKWRGSCISISWFLHFQLTSFLFNFLLFGNILLIFQILSNACYFPKLFYVRCRYHLRKTYFLPYNAQLRVVFYINWHLTSRVLFPVTFNSTESIHTLFYVYDTFKFFLKK